jgi:hypothetical protein
MAKISGFLCVSKTVVSETALLRQHPIIPINQGVACRRPPLSSQLGTRKRQVMGYNSTGRR